MTPHSSNFTSRTGINLYRSVPAVGTVFSKFAYDGILQHFRQESSRKPLNLGAEFNIKPLNIIKFPVSKYESIYRSKRLQHSSSYQVYSALFTFEYVTCFAKALAKANKGISFRIGIIAPYRAQADLIDKLVGSESVPAEIDIQVGTIHGFQGDECDIIFAVFNTPPSITDGKDMFLNKRNIINVSISRAKDYLFIIMPDDNTENIQNLRLVKRVEQLIKSSNVFSETQTSNLEQTIFGSSTYLEDNSFSTGHQSVNVYGLPEKCYEVRSEDTAVDIQVHRPVKESVALPTRTIAIRKESSNEALVLDTVDFLWLEQKTKQCPFDKSQMKTRPISVAKKDGTVKKINMLLCASCKRRYIAKGSLPESINLEEFNIRGSALSAKFPGLQDTK